MSSSLPIGVFDSGVGGLSILRHIRELMPAEHLLYVADTAHMPYGPKSRAHIEGRSLAIAAFLTGHGAKALVVACNTATAAAIHTLRARYALPVIGVEPAVKPACTHSHSGVVGVLATSGTLVSDKFRSLLERFGSGKQVIIQPCPGLVEQVEQGDLSGPATRALVERYVAPLLARGADSLVLGCTHYPFLLPLIQDIAGPETHIYETGAAVARELRRRLHLDHLLNPAPTPGTEQFWTSGDTAQVGTIVQRLWGGTVPVRSWRG